MRAHVTHGFDNVIESLLPGGGFGDNSDMMKAQDE